MATHVFRSYRPGPYPHKGKGVCVCAIYDNNVSPIKIIILYFIQIRHTDDFPPSGTLLVIIMAGMAVILRGWLPHRGEAQMGYTYRFTTRTMF